MDTMSNLKDVLLFASPHEHFNLDVFDSNP